MKRYNCPQTGREIVQLTNHPSYNTTFYPTCNTWSADGRFIFFESSRQTEGYEATDKQLMQADVATGELTRLAAIPKGDPSQYGDCHIKGVSSHYHSDYSPETDRIIFYDQAGHHIYNYDRVTGKTIELWHETEGTIGDPLDYATDGSRIAFYALFPGPKANRVFSGITSCIFTLDIDLTSGRPLGEPKPVTCFVGRKGTSASPENTFIDHPQFNPTNKEELIFAHEYGVALPDGTPVKERTWYVQADGRNEHPLCRRTEKDFPTHEVFGPKGDAVFYADMGRAFKVDLKTETVAEVVPVKVGCNCCHIAVSPDEKWIVADSLAPVGTDENGLPLGTLVLINLETKAFQTICAIPISRHHPGHPHPIFSPDGTKIAFTMVSPSGTQAAYCDISDLIESGS